MQNPYPLFKFIEDKKDIKVPFEAKLFHAPEAITKEDLDVKGDLDISDTQITSLPDNLKVGGYLGLVNTKITSLPNNLEVGEDLWLANTLITFLPNGLKVGGDLYLNNTPLSKKYTEEEIRKMIEDKGGYVGGAIYGDEGNK